MRRPSFSAMRAVTVRPLRLKDVELTYRASAPVTLNLHFVRVSDSDGPVLQEAPAQVRSLARRAASSVWIAAYPEFPARLLSPSGSCARSYSSFSPLPYSA